MIEGIKSQVGQPRARLICDTCGRGEVIPCPQMRLRGKVCARGTPDPVPDQGKARSKAQRMGWQVRKTSLACPTCAAAARAAPTTTQCNTPTTKPETAEMTTAPTSAKKTPDAPSLPDQPSREIKRAIMDLLKDCYDVPQARYRRGDTDDTIADVVGARPAWVAELREEFFGTLGGNEEIDTLDALEAKGKLLLTDLEKITAALSHRIIVKAGISRAN